MTGLPYDPCTWVEEAAMLNNCSIGGGTGSPVDSHILETK